MPDARHTANERGFALAMTLFTIAMLTGLTATAFKLSQTDMQVGRNYRSAAQGLYAAEAGLAHAIVLVNQTYSIDLKTAVIDRWANRVAPFESSTSGRKAMARQSNFAYRVAIAPDPYNPTDASRALLTSSGTGADDTVRTVLAYVRRSGVPVTPPGALYLATDQVNAPAFNGNSFLIDGNDKNLNGTPGPKRKISGIKARTESNAQAARDALSKEQKGNVRGEGYVADPVTPSVAAGDGPTTAQLSQMIDDLLRRPGLDATSCSGGKISGNLQWGNVAAPRITYCNNSSGTQIKATGSSGGAGILIVDNDLEIDGSFDFKGLILVRGTLKLKGSVALRGSVWSTDLEVSMGGNAILQYSSEALELANASGGGNALPQDVVATAWRDSF